MISTDDLRQLYRAEQFDQVLTEILAIPSHERSQVLLVMQGCAIQLCDDARFELADAEACFRAAIAVDPRCVEAYLELGYFYGNVLDQAAQGLVFFQQAKKILRGLDLEVTQAITAAVEDIECSPEHGNGFAEGG